MTWNAVVFRHRRFVATTVLLALALCLHATPIRAEGATASFHGVGWLPDTGIGFSYVHGMSGDGSVVVGQARSKRYPFVEAYRWDATNGIESLDTFGPNIQSTYGIGASYDASVIVGNAKFLTDLGPFLWTPEAGAKKIPAPPPRYDRWAEAISGNGNAVVGTMGVEGGNEAFVYTPVFGMGSIGTLSGGPGYASAMDVSDDGSVVVGFSHEFGGYSRAFLWRPYLGMRDLGVLSGYSEAQALGVSADGRVVVGYSSYPSGPRAFRWDQENGLVALTSDWSWSRANAVSADGRVIVGEIRGGPDGAGQGAALWIDDREPRLIREILEDDFGLDLAGWGLGRAIAISDDGLTIAGNGGHDGETEGWVAVVPRVLAVAIDIKPGSDSNAINPFARGVVPVAILGSDTFDVANVDVTTLAFGPDGAVPKHKNGGHLQDVNGDGLTDLLSHYRIPETGIAPGDTEACVTGETLGGTRLEGCDDINTQPPCGNGFAAALMLPPLVWIGGRRRRTLRGPLHRRDGCRRAA